MPFPGMTHEHTKPFTPAKQKQSIESEIELPQAQERSVKERE